MFKLADQSTAQKIIKSSDVYLESMKPFEWKLKMNTKENTSFEAFQIYLERCASAFSKDESERLETILYQLKKQLLEIGISNVETINIVKTTGKDEWNSAYTRGNTIFLPEKKMDTYSDKDLLALLAHEFFHVYSRYNREIKLRLYGLLGYSEYDSNRLPIHIKNQVLINPDAMTCVSTEIHRQNKLVKAIPLIIVDKAVDSSKDIVESLRIVLYIPEENSTMNIKDIPKVEDILKTNCDFAQHPEETLAENFALLVTDSASATNREFLDKVLGLIKN